MQLHRFRVFKQLIFKKTYPFYYTNYYFVFCCTFLECEQQSRTIKNNQEHHLAYHKKNDIEFGDILPDSEISDDAANSDKFSRNIVNNSEESESSDKCSMHH